MNSLTLPPTIIESAIDSDPYLKSIHSKRQYKSHLKDFEAYRHGRLFSVLLVNAYVSSLQRYDLAPSTINQRLAAIRWWARWLIDYIHDYATDKDAAREYIEQAARVSKIRDIKGSRPPRGRHLGQDEIVALLTACVRDLSEAAGRRDAAMLMVGWSCGLRRAEICSLKLDDIKRTDKGPELYVVGKGDKFRSVPLHDLTVAAIKDWIAIRGNAPGYLFGKIYKNGKLPKRYTKPLSGEALRLIEDTRAREAGIEPTTWHDLRRTLAGNLWSAGMDGSTIQEILGHANQNQTKRYDHRNEDRKREAINAIFIPNVKE